MRRLRPLAAGTAHRLLLLHHRLRRRLALNHDETRIIEELLRVDARLLGARCRLTVLFYSRFCDARLLRLTFLVALRLVMARLLRA